MNVKPSDSSPQASLSVDILCEADYIICLRLTSPYYKLTSLWMVTNGILCKGLSGLSF